MACFIIKYPVYHKLYSQNYFIMKRMLFILLFIPALLTAQNYVQGTVEFKNGKKLECLLKFPSGPNDKNIETRLSEKADKVSYPSDKLAKVIVNLDDGGSYEFSRERIRRLLSSKTTEVWILTVEKGYATLYVSTNKYRINKKGHLEMISIGGPHSAGEIFMLVKRPDEKVATILGSYSESITINENGAFRKLASDYFKDCPELVKRIKEKEFKILDSRVLVMEYNRIREKTM